ncbi:MAG: hypothetical protein ACI4S9_00190 [Christensenellales bacterium]
MKKIENALLKKALGYTVTETVEEYSTLDGALELQKKKITKKHIPPDMTALKLVLDKNSEDSYDKMTDEELERERFRLLKELDSKK